jgi:hypothetical protein
MWRFYSEEDNELVGHAQSSLPCKTQDEGDDHPPHVWSPEIMADYGPFFCAGYPEIVYYTLEGA